MQRDDAAAAYSSNGEPMTGTPDHHDITGEQRERSQEPIRYPTNHVLAVLDTGEQVTATVAALTKRGFLESEVEVGTGAERADALHAATGHVGLTDLMIRLAQRVGVADEEMETKRRYEQAMRDDRFLVLVAAPTEERKQRAIEILREHGAHTLTFFGKHTIEYITPPNKR